MAAAETTKTKKKRSESAGEDYDEKVDDEESEDEGDNEDEGKSNSIERRKRRKRLGSRSEAKALSKIVDLYTIYTDNFGMEGQFLGVKLLVSELIEHALQVSHEQFIIYLVLCFH